jgi:hypothetical protein
VKRAPQKEPAQSMGGRSLFVGTLASYLQAVGADREIRAVFPDGRAVTITEFSEDSI